MRWSWSLAFLLFLLPLGGLAGKPRRLRARCKQSHLNSTNSTHKKSTSTHKTVTTHKSSSTHKTVTTHISTHKSSTHKSTPTVTTHKSTSTTRKYTLQVSYEGNSFLKYVVTSLFRWISLNRLVIGYITLKRIPPMEVSSTKLETTLFKIILLSLKMV